MMTTSVGQAQIPDNWAQHSVEDTIDVPFEKFWDIKFQLKLEEIGSAADYKDLPKITKTTPVKGDFSKLGDSRRVHFDTDQSLLETIIHWDAPNSFAYELTELEIELKKAAKRARGQFQFFPTADGMTRVQWTYGIAQKNFIFKWLINRYIKQTHQYWMKDSLREIKRQSEQLYQNLSQ